MIEIEDGLNQTIIKNEFESYELETEIIDALSMLGYVKPTEIQKRVIPIALLGKDIVAKSATGSGKTAAFAIPVCDCIKWEENAPQALVLEPTRELAVQVRDEIFNIGRKKRIKAPAIFGGMPIDKQIVTLKQKSHIIVGTPGRIMDHVRRQSINLSRVKYLIIDEADLMLDMGFLDEVESILEVLPKDKRVLLFSATMSTRIDQLIEKHMNQPEKILIEETTETAVTVEQILYETAEEEKYANFLKVLIHENPVNCMIFCATREMVNVLYQKLKRDHIRCGMLHGELEQRDRLRTIEAFRAGKFHYLVATDVAARGVDFEAVTHIVNYDFPNSAETYVHRIGRTGRNGKTGKAISFITVTDRRMLRAVEEYSRKEIQVCLCPDNTETERQTFRARQEEKIVLKASKGSVFNQSISELSISGGRKSKMRPTDIVGTLCSISMITADDIGIIDIRDSITYVEILNGKGEQVYRSLQTKTIKGKIRKIKKCSTK